MKESNMKAALGSLFNLLLFAGYGVYCGFYVARNYRDPNVFLAILAFLGIFLAARILIAVIYYTGRLVTAAVNGFKISYFETVCFKVWFDGERTRFRFIFDPSILFGGTVMVRIKDKMDTREGFKKNSKGFLSTYLGGLFAMALITVLLLVYSVLAVSLRFAFSPAAFALIVAVWLITYNAFTENRRAGDFLHFLRLRGDSELFVTTVASQSIVEDTGTFLLTEAQEIIKFKIENDMPVVDRHSMNVLCRVAALDALGDYRLYPEIEEYLNTRLYSREKLLEESADTQILAALRVRYFAARCIVRGEKDKAAAMYSLAAELLEKHRLRDTSFKVFLADMTRILSADELSEEDIETLEETDFLDRDTYACGFIPYRHDIDRLDREAHAVLFAELPEEEDEDGEAEYEE